MLMDWKPATPGESGPGRMSAVPDAHAPAARADHSYKRHVPEADTRRRSADVRLQRQVTSGLIAGAGVDTGGGVEDGAPAHRSQCCRQPPGRCLAEAGSCCAGRCPSSSRRAPARKGPPARANSPRPEARSRPVDATAGPLLRASFAARPPTSAGIPGRILSHILSPGRERAALPRLVTPASTEHAVMEDELRLETECRAVGAKLSPAYRPDKVADARAAAASGVSSPVNVAPAASRSTGPNSARSSGEGRGRHVRLSVSASAWTSSLGQSASAEDVAGSRDKRARPGTRELRLRQPGRQFDAQRRRWGRPGNDGPTPRIHEAGAPPVARRPRSHDLKAAWLQVRNPAEGYDRGTDLAGESTPRPSHCCSHAVGTERGRSPPARAAA